MNRNSLFMNIFLKEKEHACMHPRVRNFQVPCCTPCSKTACARAIFGTNNDRNRMHIRIGKDVQA